MIRDWLRERRARMEEARAAAERSRVEHERIHQQWPDVHRAVGFSREQRRINHLSELILDMHRGEK